MMSSGEKRHTPMRMCTICRARFPKQELTRYVCRPVEYGKPLAIKDSSQKLPGRGYYLCASAACADKFQRSKAWQV